MPEKKTPKTIATINLKDGVGKTTMTWCLGDYISTYRNDNTLIFHLDGQMSLTQAIILNDDGSIYEQSATGRKGLTKGKRPYFTLFSSMSGPKSLILT